MCVKIFIVLLLFPVFTSCFFAIDQVKNKTLPNRTSKIPQDDNYFKHKYHDQYVITHLNDIDTDAVYVKIGYINPRGERHFDQPGETRYTSIYRFYENGNVNRFTVNTKEIDQDPELDPDQSGSRGVSFVKRRDTVIDMIGAIDQARSIGRIHLRVRLEQDTLFVRNRSESHTYLYLKRPLTEKNRKFKAEW
tara:strand:- start:23 stop:598 length:576 start_codon:yes stop_codon:yes gene_type:complete